MIYKKNSDILLETISLKDKIVVDVGCGEGALVRLMAGQGAHVTGLEINLAQLAKARATPLVADETYIEGVAQALPMNDASVNVVVFSNSLHHVPVDDQARALAESARVLSLDGMIFISEPLAEGRYFSVVSLIHDETVVRAKALEAIRAAGHWGLEPVREIFLLQKNRFTDFDAFRRRQIAVDPVRAPIVVEQEAEIRAAFERHGKKGDDGWSFDQPMRINLLRKRAVKASA